MDDAPSHHLGGATGLFVAVAAALVTLSACGSLGDDDEIRARFAEWAELSRVESKGMVFCRLRAAEERNGVEDLVREIEGLQEGPKR